MNSPAPKVLMVDDEPRNLRILADILAPLHYDLRQAANGREALEQVAANPPDMVLLDVMMPGISGFEVCRQLKSQPETQFIPIVLVTALADRDSKITGIEADADDFISKPVDPNELRARVRSLLRIKSLHDELQETQGQLIRELEKELQTAHDMQMGLMPTEHPQIEGFDIAGRCLPASHVRGDYFQYFHQHGRLFLSLTDVAGHAMEAAIPVVMFSGILKSHMELEGTLQERFERLNRSLHGTLTGHTFICFVMGELDLSSHTFRLSNGGCPYPYHFHASTRALTELQVGAYPFGVRPSTDYQMMETQLEPGDRVIFCSDGIMEAENGTEEQFGYERTEETIRHACVEDFSAKATIDRILKEVDAFRGDTSQSDDMTCVVVRVEEVRRT